MNVKKWNEYQQTQDTAIKSIIRRSFYSLLSWINPLFSKRNRILIYESKHLEDSNLAVALYLIQHRDYDLVCYTSENMPDNERYEGIHYIHGMRHLLKYCLTSKVIIQTHTQQIKFHPTKNQLVLQMWHGTPIKKSDHLLSSNPKQNLGWYFTKICYPSEYFKETYRIMLGGREEQMFLNNYPRTDLLLRKDDYIISDYSFTEGYDKCILWMPTYRNAPSINLGGRFDNKFPILNGDNIEQFNEFLKGKNTLVLIKLHPLQAEIDGINWNWSNILRIDNDFLSSRKIQLYSLLQRTDSIITDYSSIVFEYALTDKPIGFAIDDIEEYRNSNGFNVNNPEVFFCGEKLYTLQDLIQFVENISVGKDEYAALRKKIRDLSNYYIDGESCRRVAELIDKYMKL